MNYPSLHDLKYFYTQFKNDQSIELLRGANGYEWDVTRLDSVHVSDREYNTSNYPAPSYGVFKTEARIISIYTPDDPMKETLYIFKRAHSYCLLWIIPVSFEIIDEYYVLAVKPV